MPTYEYACNQCGHKLEVFQSIRAERLVKCPACAKDGLQRLIGTGAGIIFKGTGFYQTDYKKADAPKEDNGKGGAEKPAAAPASDGSKQAAASASSSETKKKESST